ncbi:MAG: MerC domain-containing protein [Bacillota bacterium]
MDEQVLAGKTIKAVEAVTVTHQKPSVMASTSESCCDVDHSKHQEFEEETDIWDKIGIFLSTLCAIHCLVTPLLVLALPVLGQAFEASWVHWAMAFVIVPVGIFAFWSGYKHHHQRRVFNLGIVGLFLVAAGSILPHEMVEFWGHDVVTILGSILLVVAHVLNRRACRCDVHAH